MGVVVASALLSACGGSTSEQKSKGDPPACGPLLQGTLLSAADCAGIFSQSADFHCEWYPDAVTISKPWGVQATCWSNPGRVICGGGL